VGFLSLKSDLSGSGNTGVGAGTLVANTADQNTATGVAALLSNTTETQNTANGALGLFSNTAGDRNNACGAFALFEQHYWQRQHGRGYRGRTKRDRWLQ
jgi:hypothetical protein